MATAHPRYAPEYRRRLIELVRAGRTPEQLAKEFEPTALTIRNWVAQINRDQLAQRRSDHRRAQGTQSAAPRKSRPA